MIEQIQNVREAFEKIWEAVGNWDLREGGRRDLGNRDSGRECGRQNRDSERREKQVTPSNWVVTPLRGAARKETRLVDADHDLKNCLVLLWQVYFNAFGTWYFSFTENDCTFSLLKVNGAFYTVLHYCFERKFLFVSKADLKKLVYHCQWH